MILAGVAQPGAPPFRSRSGSNTSGNVWGDRRRIDGHDALAIAHGGELSLRRTASALFGFGADRSNTGVERGSRPEIGATSGNPGAHLSIPCFALQLGLVASHSGDGWLFLQRSATAGESASDPRPDDDVPERTQSGLRGRLLLLRSTAGSRNRAAPRRRDISIANRRAGSRVCGFHRRKLRLSATDFLISSGELSWLPAKARLESAP
jgi:hypothetical protein